MIYKINVYKFKIKSKIKSSLNQYLIKSLVQTPNSITNTALSGVIDSMNLQTCSPRIKAFTSPSFSRHRCTSVPLPPESADGTPYASTPDLTSALGSADCTPLARPDKSIGKKKLTFGQLPTWAMKKVC